jgi:hypothetical protein
MVDSGAEDGFPAAESEAGWLDEKSGGPAGTATIHPVLFGASVEFPGASGGELTEGTGRKG